MTKALYMRYLGVLGLLCECSVQVDDETRETIEQALNDACKHHGLVWRRTLNRFDIEPNRNEAEG